MRKSGCYDTAARPENKGKVNAPKQRGKKIAAFGSPTAFPSVLSGRHPVLAASFAWDGPAFTIRKKGFFQ
jgi:hypothetical protein